MTSKPNQRHRSAQALLLIARAGSSDAVGEILESCRTYLMLIANEELDRDLRAKVAASDLVQETFVAAQGKIDQFSGETTDDLNAWLRGILNNKLQDARRRYRAGKRLITREEPIEDMNSQARALRERSSRHRSPSRHAAASEEAERIARALSSLSPEHQQVLQLRNWKLLDFDEIGRQMNRTKGAARALWVRALEQLSKALESRDAK
jgi:RNA polymerase sigma-70 factor (ECF subfamily)